MSTAWPSCLATNLSNACMLLRSYNLGREAATDSAWDPTGLEWFPGMGVPPEALERWPEEAMNQHAFVPRKAPPYEGDCVTCGDSRDDYRHMTAEHPWSKMGDEPVNPDESTWYWKPGDLDEFGCPTNTAAAISRTLTRRGGPLGEDPIETTDPKEL